MKRRLTPAICVLVLGLGVFGGGYAAGDPEAGKGITQTCLGCHGLASYTNVYPTYRVPKLGGQHPEYIVAALKAYKNGERDHATMQAQAASLSDQDMENIAAYLETKE